MNSKKPLLKPRAVKFQKDMLKWSGSSEILKKMTDFNKISNRRLKMMMAVIMSFFLVIAFQLVQVQIYSQQEYIYKLENYTKSYMKITPARGQIYDRNGLLLVENAQVLNMIYYPMKGVSDAKEWELAELVASSFAFPVDVLSSREKKDAYINLYADKMHATILPEEWDLYYSNTLPDRESYIYNLKLARISEAELASFADTDISKSLVKIAMDAPSGSQPKTIKEDLTRDEIAYLAENKEVFQGFDYAWDWKRNYLYDSTWRSIFGTVTTSKQGIPAEMQGLLLAKGYSRNDRIGKTGIELQYESLLKGTNTILNQQYDELTGLPYSEEISPGKKGNDLKLAMNIELQKEIDALLTKNLNEAANNEYRAHLKNLYLVLMNPMTGEIYAMSGKQLNADNKVIDNTEAVYNASGFYPPGSSVKGVTVYMAMNRKLMKPDEKILDAPLYIQGTPVKKSWQNFGPVSEIDALKYSSNVYMFHVALRLANARYIEHKPLQLKESNFYSAFDTMRNYFSQFGLGVKTGIDLPNEAIGYKGNPSILEAGHLLDAAIGQYDNYNTIELAQYVATIANGGKRVQPKIVLEAYETGTNNVVFQNKTTIINTLDDAASLKRVQIGMRECVTTGYCSSYINAVGVDVAAKSGTAEDFVPNTRISSPNSTFVAYAPYTQPEVVVACAAPNAWVNKSQTNICQKITADALKAYFRTK